MLSCHGLFSPTSCSITTMLIDDTECMQTFYLIKMCEILDLIIKKFLEFKNLRWKNVHAAVSRTKPILPIYSDFPNQAWLKCKPHSKFHREILYFDIFLSHS